VTLVLQFRLPISLWLGIFGLSFMEGMIASTGTFKRSQNGSGRSSVVGQEPKVSDSTSGPLFLSEYRPTKGTVKSWLVLDGEETTKPMQENVTTEPAETHSHSKTQL